MGKSPANSRQILARAHRHIEQGRRRYDVSRDEREEVARRFLAAWEEGDTAELIELLAPDATVFGDGGGKAPAMPAPLVGAERVAKALIGWGRQARERGIVHRRASVNGEPGLVFYEPDGRRALGRRARDRGRGRRRRALGAQPRQARAPWNAVGGAPGRAPLLVRRRFS